MYTSMEEDFIDRVRSCMEKCDNLQGFQAIVDATNGFGGFADSVFFHLQDEYPSKCILAVPVINGRFSENSTSLDDVKRTIKILLTYQKLVENSSLLVLIGTNTAAWRSLEPPLVFPNLMYNHSDAYQKFGILASFLDTTFLKYRSRDDCGHLNDLVAGLNHYNKKIRAASMSLPFLIAPGFYLLDTLENLDDYLPLWSQLTSVCSVKNDAIFYQKITVGGIPVARLRNPSVIKENSKAYLCSGVEELIHLYLTYRLTTISDVTSTEIPLKTEMPYPKMFSRHISPSGSVDEISTRMENFNVESCPVITGLHCCKGVSQVVNSLHRCVKAVNLKIFHHFFGTHMDLSEFNECLEKLLAMVLQVM